MKHERREIETPDGITLRAESWTPAEIRCVVVISHGAGEHIGRYADVASDLEEIGAWVIGPDHRGQGESGGAPGHIESFDQYGHDLVAVMDAYAKERPDAKPGVVPWFVFGHSMGGLIVLNALVADILPSDLRGVLLSAPLLRLALQPPTLKVWLGKFAALVAPGMTLPSGLDPKDISRDEDQVARYAADPRRVEVVSARWFQQMNAARVRVLEGVRGLKLPLYWYAGTGDKICDHAASLEAFSTLPTPEDNDQTLQSFEGYYHELHNEPPELRKPVIDALRNWIAARID
ncbi:MAG: lysophospholipase [Nannocystales bacterium]